MGGGAYYRMGGAINGGGLNRILHAYYRMGGGLGANNGGGLNRNQS